jgi:hypothetical protein
MLLVSQQSSSKFGHEADHGQQQTEVVVKVVRQRHGQMRERLFGPKAHLNTGH